MSKAEARVWDRLIEDMDPLTLRRTDQDALAALCEDQALLSESYTGLRKMVELVRKKAEAEGKTLPAGPLAAVLTMTNGRLALAAIRDLAARLVVERREFGLTPSARTRVGVSGSADSVTDELDDAVFNQRVQRLDLPKPN